jgi:hypothetical protein
MDRVAVLMEEYRTLRDESLTALKLQHGILQFGVAGLGVLLGLGADMAGLGSALLLLAAVPVLALLIVVIWSTELRRMVRAGTHLVGIERRVNGELDSELPILTWETSIRNGQLPRITGKDLAVTLLLAAISILSLAIGATRLVDEERTVALAALLPFGLVVVVIIGWWYYWYVRGVHQETL